MKTSKQAKKLIWGFGGPYLDVENMEPAGGGRKRAALVGAHERVSDHQVVEELGKSSREH